MVLNEVLLSVKNAIAANHNTWPILARLVHSHLMFFPVGLCFESFERLLLCTVRAEHERIARLLLVEEGSRRCNAEIICRGKIWLMLHVKRAADIRGRSQKSGDWSRWVQADWIRTRFCPPHAGA
jgi:hypothetical protein